MLFADFFDGWFWFWLFVILMGICQICSSTVNLAKKAIKNEQVQEAGKGILASWLESMFR